MRWFFLVFMITGLAATEPRWFGTLQHREEHRPALLEQGITATVLGLAWERWQPNANESNQAYIDEVRERLAALKRDGMAVVLDFGMQYPPLWIFDLPHSRYRNQFGVEFVDPAPGMNGVNAVFNAELRRLQADYAAAVFAALGHDFLLIRLGWGWYSELNFPKPDHRGRSNCYWAFDDIAQGIASGLPEGIAPCPVPGWIPGQASVDHDAARRFALWYIDALKDYHDWQIATVRALHPGRLAMLYPSWGLRPGQLDAAIAHDLDGSNPNQHRDLAMGEYWPSMIAGINDPGVVVYSTWLDAPFGDDHSPDAAQWCPMRWLASLAAAKGLAVAGENTGNNDVAALQRCFARSRELNLLGFFWAFEDELFDGAAGHATVSDFGGGIAAEQAAGR
jgi:hypothetical protein